MAESSTASLFRDFPGLSLSSRKSKTRSDESIKDLDTSPSRVSQWRASWRKKHPKQTRSRRGSVSSKGEDVDSLKKDLHHERKLLRRALRELRELRRDRDEIDGQRHKATSDLKRLREKDAKKSSKLIDYKQKLRVQDAALEQYRASIKGLRSEATVREEKIEKLTAEGTKAKVNTERLREKLRRERAEVLSLKSVHSGVKTPITSRLLQANYDELSRNFALSQEELKALQEDHASLEKGSTRMRRERDEARRTATEMERLTATQGQNLKNLAQSILDLKQARDLAQPILQIGVDIRLRNLESARECLLKIKEAQKDRAILLSGNIAAHRANGAIDAALFMAGLIPEDYLPEATEIFEKLYQVAPSNYGCWSPMILRMIDCQATISTVQVQHRLKKFDTSHLREEHDRLQGYLLSRQKKLSPGAFETDPAAKDLLARIEDNMEQIVDLSRGKRKGRKIFQPFVYEESEDEKPKSEKAHESSSEDDEESEASIESSVEDESDSSEDDDTSEESSEDEAISDDDEEDA